MRTYFPQNKFMKKRYLYILLAVCMVGALSFTLLRFNSRSDQTHYELKNRKGPAAQTAEWMNTLKMATALSNQIKLNAGDNKARLALSALFIQEARITGDHVYYDMAAMKYVNDVLKNDPNNFEALIYKALLFLSQHHFADGLATASQAQKINPYNAFVYGILVDANVELGNYQAAVENSDRMVSIRPDIRSYSRISYLREIHGDYPGAIEAMKMAVQAGIPGDESTEWARIQLGRLYENTGDLRSAQMHYMISLQERPGYAYALAGQARIATAGKDYQQAIKYYLQADSQVSDYSFKEELVDLYRLSKMNKQADDMAIFVIEGMNKDAQSGQDDQNMGHYADRELAHAYLKINKPGKALDHAMLEYNRRPENIDVNETVAWVYYNKGEYKEAVPYISVALKTKSKNPTLLCRAGLIFSKAGDKNKAKSLLLEALEKNPNISEELRSLAFAELNSLSHS